MNPMTLEVFRQFVFDILAEPIAKLACVGPPECQDPECARTDQHYDTSIGTFGGVIEVEINDKTYVIRVEER